MVNSASEGRGILHMETWAICLWRDSQLDNSPYSNFFRISWNFSEQRHDQLISGPAMLLK